MVSSSVTPICPKEQEDKSLVWNACGSNETLESICHIHCQPKQVNNLEDVKNTSNLDVKGEPSCSVSNTDNGGKIPILWKSRIPSKKRTPKVYKRRMTPMEKFHQQLLDEWIKQGKPDEYSQEEVLLFHDMNNFIPRNEIGLGSIFLKPDYNST